MRFLVRFLADLGEPAGLTKSARLLKWANPDSYNSKFCLFMSLIFCSAKWKNGSLVSKEKLFP